MQWNIYAQPLVCPEIHKEIKVNPFVSNTPTLNCSYTNGHSSSLLVGETPSLHTHSFLDSSLTRIIDASELNYPALENTLHVSSGGAMPPSYTIISNGGFEAGNLIRWAEQVGLSKGRFVVSNTRSVNGRFSVRASPGLNFTGPGFAAKSDFIPVTPGSINVLSAFFYTVGLTGGALYIDLNDVKWHNGGDVEVKSTLNIPGWQFLWREFTVPDDVTEVRVRLVRDGRGVRFIQLGYIDDVAVTPVDEFSVEVPNQLPIADAGADINAFTGEILELNGSSSFDPDNDPLNFSWSLVSRPEGSSVTITDSQTVVSQIVPDIEGLYIAQLIVNDGHSLSDPDLVTLTVVSTVVEANMAPILTLSTDAIQYSEGQGPLIIDRSVTVEDEDSLDFEGGILSVEIASGATGDDVLALNNQGLVTLDMEKILIQGIEVAMYSSDGNGAETLLIFFNEFATAEVVEIIVQNITYENTAQSPLSHDRMLQFSLTDGDGGQNPESVLLLQVLSMNGPPIARDDDLGSHPISKIVISLEALLINDIDNVGDELIVELLMNESQEGGSLTLANSQIIYQAQDGFSGLDFFSYKVTDGLGGTDEAQVRLQIVSVLNHFEAYNDFSWAVGQLSGNITLYTSGNGAGIPPQGDEGFLVDYFTGLSVSANLHVSGGSWNGGIGVPVNRPQSNHTLLGGPANPGTEAFEVFNGKLNMTGVLSYGETEIVLSFSGLDSGKDYELTLFGNRDNPKYAKRISTITLLGVDAFRNVSNLGANEVNEDDEVINISHGYNTLSGFVARYSNIDAGDDGAFIVTVTGGEHYLNALSLKSQDPSLVWNLDLHMVKSLGSIAAF